MISSRRASPAGLSTTRSPARSLAQGGFAITSGSALGIDGVTHEGVLEVGGVIMTVPDTGLHRLYPRCHEALTRRIIKGGDTLVSELSLDSPPLPVNFPRRDRTVSELSLDVLTAGTSPAGGSLIAVRLTME